MQLLAKSQLIKIYELNSVIFYVFYFANDNLSEKLTILACLLAIC